MKYENQLAARTMFKVLAGIDIAESALVDMQTDDALDLEFLEIIKEASKACSKVVAKYDSLHAKNQKAIDYLSEMYEDCNKSVDYKIRTFVEKRINSKK